MKRAPFLVLCTVVVAFTIFTPARAQVLMASVDDVILLTQNNISDQTILAFLANRRFTLPLDAEVLRLREAGVSEEIIRYLLENSYPLISIGAVYARPLNYYPSYPSYYYGTWLFSVSAFSHHWHDHHYFGFSHAADHHGLNHHLGLSLGHRIGVTVGNRHDRNHDLGVTVGNRHDRNHDLGLNRGHVSDHGADHHVGPGDAHRSGHHSGHVGRHRSTHGRGHSDRHHGSHGSGH